MTHQTKDSVKEGAFVLRLRWTCTACDWQHEVDAPDFAGDGHYHYPDGTTPCGPLVARPANLGPIPIRDATPERVECPDGCGMVEFVLPIHLQARQRGNVVEISLGYLDAGATVEVDLEEGS